MLRDIYSYVAIKSTNDKNINLGYLKFVSKHFTLKHHAFMRSFDNPALIYLIFKDVVAKYRHKHWSIVCFLKNSKNCIRLRLRTLKYA